MNRKIILLPLLVLLMTLVACDFSPSTPATSVPTVVQAEMATATEPPPTIASPVPPTATHRPTATASLVLPTSTLAPTATEKICLALLSPSDEEWVRAYGYLTFEWEPWPDAQAYRLQIVVPNGWVMSVDLQKTYQDRFMQTLAAEGAYTWKVTALDGSGEPICCSEEFIFNKQGSETSSGGGDQPAVDTIIKGGG